MPVSLHHVVVDAHDLPGLARFWSQVLDWPILSEREREVVIGPADDAPIGMCFMPSPDEKVVKNRVHVDLNPGADVSDSAREAEIERIIALGARRVDVGQRGDETWTVLADLEGNEFCVIRAKRTLTT
jgi:predicted enzyme related to lactoylglutathione lyase